MCDGDIKDQTILLVAEPWRLVLCDTPDLWHHLCQCCHLIGYHGDILTVLEWLQGMIDDDTETKANQAQLVWNQVILGQFLERLIMIFLGLSIAVYMSICAHSVVFV